MHIQNWIHRLTEGSGARSIRVIGLVLGFVALASGYNLYTKPEFSSQYAMDTAQVARNLAEGKGYTTESIRPLALSLLQKHSKEELQLPIPDVSNPPGFPVLLAGVFKLLPFNFADTPGALSSQALELWITGLNQALFFCAILLLFKLARLLFDNSVAWLASGMFAATDLFWRFSTSGLPTMLLIVIFLAIVWCLVKIETRDSASAVPQAYGFIPAVSVGALTAIGGLTSYSFVLLIVPVLLFLGLGITQGRRKLCLAAAVSFLVVMTPWLARNYTLTGTFFGTTGYAILQDTPAFPGDALERCLDAQAAMTRISPRDIINKIVVNTGSILQNDVPKLGGNWLTAFFLVGLLIPYRNKTLSKIRFFLLGTAVLFIFMQAVGKTHLSTELPEVNPENFLALLAPLVFMFGVSLYFTLIDQLIDLAPDARMAATLTFGTILCSPFLLTLLSPPVYKEASPWDPSYIQWITPGFEEKELIMSDVPSAVAWHGRRSCLWLTLDNREEFSKLNAKMPVQALYLTQLTTDHFLSKHARNKSSWERFALECWAHGEVPDNFPLTKAPLGFLPDRIFLSDEERWLVKEN